MTDDPLFLNDPNFPEKLNLALGLEEGDTIQIILPQFDRVDGKVVEEPDEFIDVEELKQKTEEELEALGLDKWSDETNLWLFPAEWYNKIPNGTVLYDIFDEELIFEKDVTDDDTRFGLLAYGIKLFTEKEWTTNETNELREQSTNEELKEELLFYKLQNPEVYCNANKKAKSVVPKSWRGVQSFYVA